MYPIAVIILDNRIPIVIFRFQKCWIIDQFFCYHSNFFFNKSCILILFQRRGARHRISDAATNRGGVIINVRIISDTIIWIIIIISIWCACKQIIIGNIRLIFLILICDLTSRVWIGRNGRTLRDKSREICWQAVLLTRDLLESRDIIRFIEISLVEN